MCIVFVIHHRNSFLRYINIKKVIFYFFKMGTLVIRENWNIQEE